jgi:hypothetical protein
MQCHLADKLISLAAVYDTHKEKHGREAMSVRLSDHPYVSSPKQLTGF